MVDIEERLRDIISGLDYQKEIGAEVDRVKLLKERIIQLTNDVASERYGTGIGMLVRQYLNDILKG